MKKTYIIKQIGDNDWAVFRKRLFGKKRITPGAFPTIYIAMEYLKNFDTEMDIKVEYV